MERTGTERELGYLSPNRSVPQGCNSAYRAIHGLGDLRKSHAFFAAIHDELNSMLFCGQSLLADATLLKSFFVFFPSDSTGNPLKVLQNIVHILNFPLGFTFSQLENWAMSISLPTQRRLAGEGFVRVWRLA